MRTAASIHEGSVPTTQIPPSGPASNVGGHVSTGNLGGKKHPKHISGVTQVTVTGTRWNIEIRKPWNSQAGHPSLGAYKSATCSSQKHLMCFLPLRNSLNVFNGSVWRNSVTGHLLNSVLHSSKIRGKIRGTFGLVQHHTQAPSIGKVMTESCVMFHQVFLLDTNVLTHQLAEGWPLPV